jgi:hypothetical protein
MKAADTERREHDPTPEQIRLQCESFRQNWAQVRIDANERRTDPVEITALKDQKSQRRRTLED